MLKKMLNGSSMAQLYNLKIERLKHTAGNKRFGAMAAEARNNGSGEFEISCAAERVV